MGMQGMCTDMHNNVGTEVSICIDMSMDMCMCMRVDKRTRHWHGCTVSASSIDMCIDRYIWMQPCV